MATIGSGYKGDIVVIDAIGRVVKRLSGRQGTVLLPVDEAFVSGEMYGIVGGPELEFIEGVKAVFSNADDFFTLASD